MNRRSISLIIICSFVTFISFVTGYVLAEQACVSFDPHNPTPPYAALPISYTGTSHYYFVSPGTPNFEGSYYYNFYFEPTECFYVSDIELDGFTILGGAAELNATQCGGGALGPQDVSSENEAEQWLEAQGFISFFYIRSATAYSADIQLWGVGTIQCAEWYLCSTVQDSHFFTDTVWSLYGSAAISDSILTLNPGDTAAQNLIALTSNSDYNAVISVTFATTYPASINLILGDETEAITITESDHYTATFTTPDLGGPLAYAIENTSAGSTTIEIDYTCLLLVGEGEPECLAPFNGEFNGADYWEWYRGAAYQPLRENAYLPYNEGGDSDKSLLRSSSTYTLPTLASGEHLILRFTAETLYNQAGVLGARVASGITDTTYFFEIYPYEYEFEADLSNMAGLDEATVAFANSGEDPVTGFTAEDDIYLDDVCLYVSEDEPGLPGPVDTDPVTPVAENWTCYECSAIPSVLYGYGINVYYLNEIYENGVSIWDPSGWVPWLAAALWVHAGYPLACWILGLWCWLLGIIQYIINEFLNWFHWARRSLEAFWIWFTLFALWIWLSGQNIALWSWTTIKDWLLWAWQAAQDSLLFAQAIWVKMLQVLGKGMNWVANNVGPGVGKILQGIANWFIDGWNNALALLGKFISSVMDDIGRWLNWVAPLLGKIWSFLSGLSLLWLLVGLLLSFFESLLELLGKLASWLWLNILQGINLPIEFFQAFNDGISDSSFSYLFSCSSQNFWCSLLAGFQLVNESAGHGIMYPAVIVGIIITTLFIFWKDILALFSINVK